jgi:hypothetical protein
MKGIIMSKNQKTELYVITNVADLNEARKQKARIERNKRLVKKFAVGAAIGFTVVTAIRMVAEVVNQDDTETTEENED